MESLASFTEWTRVSWTFASLSFSSCTECSYLKNLWPECWTMQLVHKCSLQSSQKKILNSSWVGHICNFACNYRYFSAKPRATKFLERESTAISLPKRLLQFGHSIKPLRCTTYSKQYSQNVWPQGRFRGISLFSS